MSDRYRQWPIRRLPHQGERASYLVVRHDLNDGRLLKIDGQRLRDRVVEGRVPRFILEIREHDPGGFVDRPRPSRVPTATTIVPCGRT